MRDTLRTRIGGRPALHGLQPALAPVGASGVASPVGHRRVVVQPAAQHVAVMLAWNVGDRLADAATRRHAERAGESAEAIGPRAAINADEASLLDQCSIPLTPSARLAACVNRQPARGRTIYCIATRRRELPAALHTI